MGRPRILLQLDSDPHPSSFDAVVALDAGVDHLLPYHSVAANDVRGLVHGAIFTRGPGELHQTAIFIGGSDVAAAEALGREVEAAFFGPLRVSLMMDANGANTTAAAAVLAITRHLDVRQAEILVLAATGPVGQRAVRLLAGGGAVVRVASRDRTRAENVCSSIRQRDAAARLVPMACVSPAQIQDALRGAAGVIGAGAAGITLVSQATLQAADQVRVAIDLNAVPPYGLEGVAVQDQATLRGKTFCYGALGIGRTKMRIHKEAIRRLFTANDQVLDAEQIFAIGQELEGEIGL